MSSNEYVSVNRLASTVAQAKPSSTYIFVYFDKYYQADFNRVNIIPLKVVAINDKKEFSNIDEVFPNIRYVSAPKFILMDLVLDDTDILYKLVIEVKETKCKDEEFNYHRIGVDIVHNKDLYDKLNPYRAKYNPIFDLDIDPDMV